MTKHTPGIADVLMDVTTSLIAAISLLSRGGKTAAPSDRMFKQMLADYQNSVDRARAILARLDGDAP